MREVARQDMGYFPTPPEMTKEICGLLGYKGRKKINVVDAGCGEGDVLVDIHKYLNAPMRLHGVELDSHRAEIAHNKVKQINRGNGVKWCGISDADVRNADLVWFNPPYDNVRGAGRYETILLRSVVNWLSFEGLLVCIVPEYVANSDEFNRTARMKLELLAYLRFPNGHYEKFKQVVLIYRCRRHSWAYNRRKIVPETLGQSCVYEEIQPSESRFHFTISQLGPCHVKHVLAKSNISEGLLNSRYYDMAIERPILPLTEGHLALALASGLCDGLIDVDGENGKEKALVKGTTDVCEKNVKTVEEETVSKDGTPYIKVTDYWRTQYTMNVTVLRENGKLERYTSDDEERVRNANASRKNS